MFSIINEIQSWFSSPMAFFYFICGGFSLILALTIHEFSHGYVAYKLGDYTAKAHGRLTLNPIKHLDVLGTILLIVYKFGWAKPVPINSANFNRKISQKTGVVLVSLAGPLSNLLLSFISFCLIAVIWHFSPSDPSLAFILAFNFLVILCTSNIGIGIFNSLPIPPLDGYKIFSAFLPNRVYWNIMRYERYGFIILLLLILSIGTFIGGGVRWLFNMYAGLFGVSFNL